MNKVGVATEKEKRDRQTEEKDCACACVCACMMCMPLDESILREMVVVSDSVITIDRMAVWEHCVPSMHYTCCYCIYRCCAARVYACTICQKLN